jgi:ABC-type glycerol-3-phosphate transport system substrate-binding protein
MTTARRRLSRTALLLLLLVLVGCSSSTGTLPAAGAARSPLMVRHAWSGAEALALQTLTDEYNLTADVPILLIARPAVTLPAELAAGSRDGTTAAAALVQSHLLGRLVEQNLLQPVDDLIAAETRVAVIPAALSAARVDRTGERRLYGLPLTFDTLVLYYTAASIRQVPADTAALLAAGRDLSAPQGAPPVWGLGYTLNLERTLPYLSAFGGSLFAADGRVNLGDEGRAGAEAWLNWLNELYRDQQLLATLDGVLVDRALAGRQVLMTIDWAHALSDYETIWGDRLGIAALPRLSETGRSAEPLVQSDVLVLGAGVSDAAVRAGFAAYAAYLLSDDVQTALLLAGRQPVLTTVDLSERSDLPPGRLAAARAFRSSAQQGTAMPNSRTADDHLRAILTDMQSSVLRGLLSAEQAVTNADAALRSRFGQ